MSCDAELPPLFRVPRSAFRVRSMKRHQSRATRETSAGGVVFRRAAGGPPRFLLIPASYENWGVPKGHLERGEAPAEAARRGVAEETALHDLILPGPLHEIGWYIRF